MLDRDPAAPRKGHSSPLFSAYVYGGHSRLSQLLLSSCRMYGLFIHQGAPGNVQPMLCTDHRDAQQPAISERNSSWIANLRIAYFRHPSDNGIITLQAENTRHSPIHVVGAVSMFKFTFAFLALGLALALGLWPWPWCCMSLALALAYWLTLALTPLALLTSLADRPMRAPRGCKNIGPIRFHVGLRAKRSYMAVVFYVC